MNMINSEPIPMDLSTRTATILDQPQVSARLFRPPQENYSPLVTSGRPVSIDVEPHVTIRGRIYPARQTDSPLILYFHGNGELASDYQTLGSIIRSRGVTFLVMDYRGYGDSNGVPMATNLLSDAVKSFDSLEKICRGNDLVPARYYVAGRSLGSAAAIEIASKASEGKLAGLIIESGFAHTFSLLSRMGLNLLGVDEDRDGFGNMEKVANIHSPTLILHGETDKVIPVSDARELFNRLPSNDKRLVIIPNSGHNDLKITGGRKYLKSILDFVEVRKAIETRDSFPRTA